MSFNCMFIQNILLLLKGFPLLPIIQILHFLLMALPFLSEHLVGDIYRTRCFTEIVKGEVVALELVLVWIIVEIGEQAKLDLLSELITKVL